MGLGRLALALALLGGGCAAPEDGELAITFDPCEPLVVEAPGATAEQVASLDDAIAMWHARGLPRLARSGAGARVELRFDGAASSFHGLYDDRLAVIWVNTALADPRERAVTIAHELGHAFGLLHVARDERRSVMNAANLSILPTDGDQAELVRLWGACPAADRGADPHGGLVPKL